jgi:Putative adhesin
MKNTILITTLAALLVPSGLWGQQEERFNRTLDVGPDAALSIGNISGDIHVEAGAGSSIVIDAVKSVEDEDDAELLSGVDIEVSQLGNRVRVSTEHTGGRGRRHRNHDGSVSVSYRVKVPKGTEVEIQSVSGNVVLVGVDGAANAQSVSGDVRVTDVSELVQAKSVSGNVEVHRARSGRHAEVESVSGEVLVEGIEASELTVSSVSGDVRLRDVSSRRASLESVSGDLEYTGSIAASGRYDFQTHSGDVVLTIGDEVGFELEASTFSGEIESDFDLETTSRAQKGKRLSAVVGDGSAVIETSTFSGDVRILRR